MLSSNFSLLSQIRHLTFLKSLQRYPLPKAFQYMTVTFRNTNDVFVLYVNNTSSSPHNKDIKRKAKKKPHNI